MQKELQKIIDTVIVESDNMDHSLNNRTTEVMVISRWFISRCTIKVNDINLVQVHKSKYLSTLVT